MFLTATEKSQITLTVEAMTDATILMWDTITPWAISTCWVAITLNLLKLCGKVVLGLYGILMTLTSSLARAEIHMHQWFQP
jgi:hypothetical protein